MNIAIYVYDNAEVLDFSGPFEVFSTAARLSNASKKPNVFLVAEKDQSINARGGFSVNPAYHFLNHPPIDVLIVVGGVHSEEVKKPTVIKWIKNTASKAQLVASICTGAFLLAQAKVLTNQKVTTHWGDIEDLRQAYPALTVVENTRWIDQGNVITSGGISAGIDMSLYLVSKLFNKDLAIKTARQMEFDWSL